MNISEKNRLESLKKIDRQSMYTMILRVLKNREMTAREIALELYNNNEVLSPSRQTTQPRCVELYERGKIKKVGKKYDELTERNVTIYALREETC